MDQLPLICPKDGSRLAHETCRSLVCTRGHSYPVIDGVPVLLRDDVEQTIPLARASLARARNEPGAIDQRNAGLFLESLGISDVEKDLAVQLSCAGSSTIDPVVFLAARSR